ncbi:hypothetical protein XI06_13350 [Bradyrhizobium sp. CCBAU 11434]|uniref:NAD(P)/FAD-dependent oxidoreductase n=1 Tax=Bradyrhizobium sp. CCBAU 11434 TaxID=1630885 RepID=UPI002306D56E|nr:FAD-dependent oxidoreductase [Bradyrhizobium sp. CCBAU 11434]MDA9521325.1 hypothetical protein [Bradyrhizobium sp. CCBAU 11434]
MGNRLDALVVGAGVVGVTAALALQQRGLKVMVVDQQSVAQGCSFGNAGVIAPGAFPHGAYYRVADLPAALLKVNSPAALDWASAPNLLTWGAKYARAARPDIVRHGTNLLHHMCRDALRSYELLLGADLPPINRRGYLAVHLAHSELKAATRLNAIRSSHGLAVRMLSGSDLIEVEPAVARVAAGATFLAESAHVTDPQAFVASLADVFMQRGGLLQCDRVEGLENKGNQGMIVRGVRENYVPRTVILATGSRANHLLADCAHHIPLAAERGYHLELNVEPGFITRPTALPSLGVVLTPSQRGARIAGISHFGLPGFRPRPRLLTCALERVRKLLPVLQARPGFEVWSGERAATPDSLPIVEQVPSNPSIFVSTGHGHAGFTLAAVTATVLADLVTNRSSSYSQQLSSNRSGLNKAH